MNQKELYAIPVSILSFAINIALFFKVFEFGFFTIFFSIFISVSLCVLVFRILWFCTGFSLVFISVIIGVGMILYSCPVLWLGKIYLGLQIIPLIALQKIEFAENLQVQKKLQRTAIDDIQSGLSNKEICKIHGIKQWDVSRLRKKLQNEPQRQK